MPGKLRVGRGADLGDRTFFFEIIPDLLLITGFDGYVRDVNTAWQNAVGWSRKELLALPFLDFIHPEDRARMAAELDSVQKGIFMMFLESRFQCKDGTYKWLMWKAAGMPGRSKLYMLGREIVTGKDGTSRPGHQDSAIERRASQLDMTQEWLGVGSWEVDLGSMHFWWSSGLARLLGHPPEEAPATAEEATRLIVAEDREPLLAAMRSAIETGTAKLDFGALRRDGAVVRLEGIVRLSRDRDGVPKCLSGVLRPLEGETSQAERSITNAAPDATK